jgi:DNA-binding transcriptional regulator GbsR (MarR family)
MADSTAAVSNTELAVADAIGRLIEFWGFKRPMGRVWTLLYLSPEPLGASELAERLSMSQSAVGLTLGELSEWGVVKKAWRPGERRYFFAAETSITKLIRRVLRERELVLLREVGGALEGAERALPKSAKSKKERSALGFKRERIARLLSLARLGESLIAALAAGEAVDPMPVLRAAGDQGEP